MSGSAYALIAKRGTGMRTTLRATARIRAVIILGLATSWPVWAVGADRPALVPLDAAAVADDVRQASAPAGVAKLEKRSTVIDAVYQSLEKVGVVQVADRRMA